MLHDISPPRPNYFAGHCIFNFLPSIRKYDETPSLVFDIFHKNFANPSSLKVIVQYVKKICIYTVCRLILFIFLFQSFYQDCVCIFASLGFKLFVVVDRFIAGLF